MSTPPPPPLQVCYHLFLLQYHCSLTSITATLLPLFHSCLKYQWAPPPPYSTTTCYDCCPCVVHQGTSGVYPCSSLVSCRPPGYIGGVPLQFPSTVLPSGIATSTSLIGCVVLPLAALSSHSTNTNIALQWLLCNHCLFGKSAVLLALQHYSHYPFDHMCISWLVLPCS